MSVIEATAGQDLHHHPRSRTIRHTDSQVRIYDTADQIVSRPAVAYLNTVTDGIATIDANPHHARR